MHEPLFFSLRNVQGYEQKSRRSAKRKEAICECPCRIAKAEKQRSNPCCLSPQKKESRDPQGYEQKSRRSAKRKVAICEWD